MKWVWPTYRIQCNYNPHTFHPSDCYVYSTTTSGKVLRTPPARGTFEYYLSRFMVEELNGPEFVREGARRACPYCNQLMHEDDIHRSVNIAIVGDSYTGKTHYIAVLIDQLQKGMLMQGKHGSASIVSLSTQTDQIYKDDYHDPILRDKKEAKGTSRGRYDANGQPIIKPPLTYQLTIRDNTTGFVRSVNLILYDIAGADIADQTSLVQFGEHILRADAILYFADPMTMDFVRNHLPSHLQPDMTKVSARTPHTVLQNMMKRFEEYKRIPPGGDVDIPTAIILSKSDLLRFTIPVPQHQYVSFFQKVVYDGTAHQKDFLQVNQDVQTCLEFYNERALLNEGARFTNVNFFAIAATGNPADSNGEYTSIDPLRCLDPFIWALSQLDCIDEAKS